MKTCETCEHGMPIQVDEFTLYDCQKKPQKLHSAGYSCEGESK